MGIHNGHAFIGLVRQLFNDLTNQYPELGLELGRDIALIEKRFMSEGLGFLTKTLPKYAKAVDIALATGDPLVIPSFHKRGKTGLPAFLWGFLNRVFGSDGRVRSNPDPGALLELRQVCYSFYKLEVPFEETVVQKKINTFVDIDNSLSFHPDNVCGTDREILYHARALLTHLFRNFNFCKMKPKHGPGAVAGGEKPWEKMRFKYFVKQIDEVFPISDWYFLNYTHLCDELQDFFNLQEVEELYSKLAAVPKDSRGPRLIGMEPLEYMWIQQAIKGVLYDHIETHPLTKGHVNFTDQMVNRDLALASSLSNEYVTLDMKDASDRVSLELVKYLFKDTPLLPALLATRTPGVVLPDGTTHRYRKFAPMGSALCFPIEALCFWALSVATMRVKYNIPLLVGVKDIYVYGDDIIVHSLYYKEILNTLPHFDLLFNAEKCCISRLFRESCGCDAFAGVDVTPIKLKKLLPQKSKPQNGNKRPRKITNPEAILSWVEYSNAFYTRGYFMVADYIRRLVEDLLGPLPLSAERFNRLSWYNRHTTHPNSLPVRYNKNLHREEVRTWALTPVLHTESERNDWSEPFRCILQGMPKRGPWVTAIPRKIQVRRAWVQLT